MFWDMSNNKEEKIIDIYFRLRFGLINRNNTYLRLINRVVCVLALIE